ncbi:hypothetical protein ACHAXS_013888 [Conticribra weissflogii]
MTSTSTSTSTSTAPSPSTPSTTELVAFANTLADEARKVILPFWRKPLDVESKVEHDRPVAESPVTIADRMAEEAMRHLIEKHHPTHGIYGEEHGSVRTTARYVWVLDPIDGTKSFITGKPLFGTLIALLEDGVPIIGIIDQCVLGERWIGVVGVGTTLNGVTVTTAGIGRGGGTDEGQQNGRVDDDDDDDGGNRKTLKESMMYATTPHMFQPGEEEEKFRRMCRAVKRPLYGADCYAYALVASGFGADLVVEADLGLYDYCALVPVVEGAGGVMTDWCGRRLCLENHEKSRGRVVACGSGDLHEEALKILGEEWHGNDDVVIGEKREKEMEKKRCVLFSDRLVYLAVGVGIGMMLARSR